MFMIVYRLDALLRVQSGNNAEVASVRWDNEREEKFSELWQQYPCLFDISSEDYQDPVKKDKRRDIVEALYQPGE